MFKFTSAALLVGLLVLSGFFLVERCNHAESRKKYNNAMVELEGTLKETDTANSVRALFEEELEAQAEALQEIINDRDEEILAQATVNLRLRDRVFKAENAMETIVTIDDHEFLEFLDKCEGYEKIRHRVDFDTVNKPMRVVGHTLTNPAYAELKLTWVEDLQLEVNLTRDEDGNFRVYTDSAELQIGDIVLKVDPSVLEVRWYERISFGADLAAGEFGAQLGLRPGYDVLSNLNVNLLFVLQYDGASAKTFYGAGVNWYPWK